MLFSDYCKNYNEICISCFISNKEYVIALDYIIPFIKKKYPELNPHLFVREDYLHLSNVAEPASAMKSNYGYTKNIKKNPQGEHSIYKFIMGAELTFPKLKVKETNSCLIFPKGEKDMTQEQVKQYKGTVCDDMSLINEDTWVIGAENEFVFYAASKGIRTTLIGSDAAKNLFKTMFPHGEIQ